MYPASDWSVLCSGYRRRGTVRTARCDWAAVVAATTKHFGKLDVLVNNAGISGSAEQDFYSTEAWHRIMAVNATGVFFGIKHAVRSGLAPPTLCRFRRRTDNVLYHYGI
jgi:NAD(P)-dependent dehydrogenase (short-subunit alcohol dehydrogenase family)